MNEIQIKVYKPDYSAIIKNHLDPKTWGQTYTVYEYKDFKVTLTLDKIIVADSKLVFAVTSDFISYLVDYKLNHKEYTLRILEKKISHQIGLLIRQHFGRKNYRPEHNKREKEYYNTVNFYRREYKHTFENMYNALPEQIRESFYDIDEMINLYIDKLLDKPNIYDYEEQHYIQELNIFKGVQNYIDNQPIGEVDISQVSIALEKYMNSEELTEDEEELIEELKQEMESVL
jgi:predicted RNA-binding protein with RPS1 domain